jgi:hypothetical protein
MENVLAREILSFTFWFVFGRSLASHLLGSPARPFTDVLRKILARGHREKMQKATAH